jgi:hypothetical protein
VKEQLGLALEPAPTAPRAAALRSFHTRRQPVTVPEALAGEQRAARQEELVLDFFRRTPGRWTPWQVADVLGLCINSARRSCTNLTAAGLLFHHARDRRPAGPYGQRSGTWEAAP